MSDKKDKGSEINEINSKTLCDYFFCKNAVNIKHIDTTLKEYIKTFLKSQQELEGTKLTLKQAHDLNNELQKISLKIWKELLNSSLEYIGFNEIVGVEELYNYQTAFRKFEEVLYGSVPFYRDHTNHCINLYLMGEMLFREKLKYQNLRMYTTNSKNENDDKSAIFCIIAMTHDLGYPIEVIHSTNEKYREMFSHYKNIKLVEPAVDFPLSYHGIFDYLIDILSLAIKPETKLETNSSDPYSRKRRVKSVGYSFGLPLDCKRYLEEGSIDKGVRKEFKEKNKELSPKARLLEKEKNEKEWGIVDGENGYTIKDNTEDNSIEGNDKKLHVYDGKIIDCIEIESIHQTQHLRPFISTALLEYNHGLFSCMKLIEHLKMFKEDYDISLDDLKSLKEIDERFLICQEILKTIIYHSSENIGIKDKKLLYLWFNLLDDLCEWSRFTMGEGYTKIPGFCTPFVKEFNMNKVEIIFEYGKENLEYVKPYKHFETIARKYYQIIEKVGTNIIIKIKDFEDDDRTFKFEYKPNDSNNPFDFKIDRIDELDSDGILKKIISEKGLSEFFPDKSKK